MIEIIETTSQHDLVTDVTDDTTKFEDYAEDLLDTKMYINPC